MNGVFIIPTGIGCAIGGHAGDACCAVNLIASCCQDLIVNPNAVNASDINEMAANCLYVEGSFIDRFLAGDIGLRKRRRNKLLLVVNSPLHPNTVNSANAARVALGIEIEIMVLDTHLTMKAQFDPNGSAGGEVQGWRELIKQVRDRTFDCLAIQSEVKVEEQVAIEYLRRGTGVNPWGGVEAKGSKLIAEALNKPVAHAPIDNPDSPIKQFCEVVDPRLSAEMVSYSFIHCILKGLARAPLINAGPNMSAHVKPDLTVDDIEFLITPDSCFGEPHVACFERGIEVIVVRENTTVIDKPFPDRCTFVDNYLEAAGLIGCRKIGVNERWVRA